MTRILESSRPTTSILDFSREKRQSFIKEKLALHKNIEQAYLFGSCAQGTAGPWSDIDLLIVMPTDLHFIERGRQFSDLYGLGVPVDILVYTPQEFSRLIDSDSGFWILFKQQQIRLI